MFTLGIISVICLLVLLRRWQVKNLSLWNRPLMLDFLFGAFILVWSTVLLCISLVAML